MEFPFVTIYNLSFSIIVVRLFTEAQKFIPHLDIQTGLGFIQSFIQLVREGALSRSSKAAGA
jgi:hypothetical protein